MTEKLISVIVPIYMGEKWLARCIDTIINQTYTNLDIILVNDGSPDESGTICDEYAKKDARIRVVHKENGGLSDARNAGLAVSKGEYIMFVDEDDMIHPQMAEILLNTLVNAQADIVVCNFKPVPDVMITEYTPIDHVPKAVCFEQPEIMNQLYHQNLITVVAWNKLYKKEIFEKAGYIKGRIHDDESAIHYILHACKKTAYIEEKLYYYVQREGSITSKRKPAYYYDHWKAYEERYALLSEHGYKQMAIWTQMHMLHLVMYNYESIQADTEGKQVLANMLTECEKILAVPDVWNNLSEELQKKYTAFFKNPQKFYKKKHQKEKLSCFINHVKEPGRRVKRILRKCWRFFYGHIYAKLKKAVTDNLNKKKIKDKYKIKKGTQNVVIFGTPNHGNLGDYAIYVAEKQLLSKYFNDSNIFGVNMTDFQHEIDVLKKMLNKKDVLILTGGGNFGNQYMDDEKIRRLVIQKFPQNKIIMFPQTMYFTNDAIGEEEKQKTVQIYSGHNDLWLMARDEQSYKEMQSLFEKNVWLLPDVVLTWTPPVNLKKEGALLVMRNDVERVLSEADKQHVIDILRPMFESVSETDTEVEIETDIDGLNDKLVEKLKQISAAKVVVTDRLHGMIFAAITKTPCLVLNNYNHKIRETYKWINHLSYVRYVSDIEEFESEIRKLCIDKEWEYSDETIQKRYDEFMKACF